MSRVNRTCLSCGKQYSYCGNCGRKNSNPAWMSTWDTENCKNVFQICSNYKQGALSKEAARKRLEKECNLKERYKFKKELRDILEEILSGSKNRILNDETPRSEGRGKLFEENDED